MKRGIDLYWKDILIATIIAGIGYIGLSTTKQTGLLDMSMEAILFFTGSMIAFWGFFSSNKKTNRYFKKFQLFYGLTYFTVVISFCMGIIYFVNHSDIIEIGIDELMSDQVLMIMSAIKSFSMVFLIITWIYFYKYLSIKETAKKKILVFLTGFLIYLSVSILIWQLTNDVNVLSLGVIVGSVIGIFALIALDKRTRYLTMIFILYSSIHLIEFYMMGKGKSLTTGFNNVAYWWATVLYVLEVRRWIKLELSKNNHISN
ncbi:hypothetical protein [Vallitalea okinawensis]|uniref:hypothetical protein n=1 Tax=Vallitalea okinawensis TaxID=2078660 RepID=UPI000CFB769D|nr:hypothetical protein [Vallitalea okinawensis]